MYRKLWIILALILALASISAAAPAVERTNTAHAQQTGIPLVILKNGDLWSWSPGGTLTQLTNWGYNERPVLSPDGQRVAYNSWATITVDALSSGQPVFGVIPSNIWVLEPLTGNAFRVADQPANAVFQADNVNNNVIMRGTPVWSPDSTQLAWVEAVVPGLSFQLVVYDFGTGTSRVLGSNLPVPYADGGSVPLHKIQWGTTGIALTNSAVNQASYDFEETLYVYDLNGSVLSQTLIGSSATEWLFDRQWVTYNNQEYIGLLYPSGKRFLLDPRTGTQQDMPALPEMYSLFAPNNAATVFSAPSTDANSNLSAVWSVVYPDRQNSATILTGGNDYNVAISTDGQTVAYVSDAVYVWQNGQSTVIPGTEGLTSPWENGIAWGPTGWRVRTDWPGTGGEGPAGVGGGGVVTCGPTPRLTVGGPGQVTPGLPNVLRTQPRRGSDSAILGEIPAGGVFAVLSGPQCGPEGRYWWQVDYQGITGWTPEGEGSTYWLQPYSADTPTVSCNLPPRLQVGTAAYVLPGLPNIIRFQPHRGSDSLIMGRIPGGSYFAVTGGPVCGPEGRYWWQVQYLGISGWTAEGEGSTYWVSPFGCVNSPVPRLSPGMTARVTPGEPNRIRSGPGTGHLVIGQIPGGEVFTVLGGPECGAEGWTWWRVSYQGVSGWTAEGQGSTYWLEPFIAPPNPTVCTMTPRLQVGGLGRVTLSPGDPNVVRTQPRRGSDSVIVGQIPAGGVFYVLEGPVCDAEGRYWWRVGYQQISGWTPEGEGGVYWLEPATTPPPPTPTCTLAPRLQVGSSGYVIPGPSNVIRSQPHRGTDSTVLDQIPGSGFFRVLSGPQCGPEGRYWWQVNYNGTIGWTAEGESGTYWLSPFVCANSQQSRLVPGMTARVTPGNPNTIRTQPGTSYPSLGQIPGSASFTVLGGPQCGPQGRIWWQVNYNGVIGWTAEGEGTIFWLEPVG